MTTIAFKDGVMVADSACYRDGLYVGEVDKIMETPRHIVGFSGEIQYMDLVYNYYKRSPALPNDEIAEIGQEAVSLIVFDKKTGAVWTTSNLKHEEKTRSKYLAVGSGADLASAVMEAGLDAETAVKVACKLDSRSGGTVAVVQCTEWVQDEA